MVAVVNEGKRDEVNGFRRWGAASCGGMHSAHWPVARRRGCLLEG
jgi:hypothetical protein